MWDKITMYCLGFTTCFWIYLSLTELLRKEETIPPKLSNQPKREELSVTVGSRPLWEHAHEWGEFKENGNGERFRDCNLCGARRFE